MSFVLASMLFVSQLSPFHMSTSGHYGNVTTQDKKAQLTQRERATAVHV